MISIESIESRFQEALFPADDGRRTDLQPAFDGVEASSFQHQDELGAKNRSLWQIDYGQKLADLLVCWRGF